MKAEDLSGMQFGEWTVIECAGSEKGHSYFLCRCSCGEIKKVRASTLRAGQSISCGHDRQKRIEGTTLPARRYRCDDTA